MVRLSTLNDINGIISVWKEAFGDSEKDIQFFLENHYKAENTVVYDFDGDIASVLFLLDGEMHINGEDYSSYYLYAACTLKKYRGRGMMSEMLEYAKRTASVRNKFFIALKPAEKTLYEYYSKFGYKSVFSKKILSIKRTDENLCSHLLYDNNDLSFSELRDKAFCNINYFKWINESIEFAIKHHKYYGGEILLRSNGYLLYSINDGVLCVKESTFQPDTFTEIISEIARNHNMHKIIVESPVNYDLISDKFEIIKSGMILPLTDDADKIINDICNAYLALTLD